MIEKNFTSLKNNPTYSLSPSEREAMRNQLLLHMAKNVPERSSASSRWFVYLMRPMPLGALTLILTVSLTSVSFAAGGALPGDLLYGVKVSVNERVARALATSPEARADVRVRQLEERLKETEVLAVRGPLPSEVVEQVTMAVNLGVEDVLEEADVLAREGDGGVADHIHARVTTTLMAHGELLTAQAQNFTDDSHDSLETLSRVAYEAADLAQRAMSDEVQDTSASDQLLAEHAKARASLQMQELTERLARTNVPEETMNTLRGELQKLSEEFDSAEQYFEQGDLAGARYAYEEIDRRAYRADTLLKTAKDIARRTDQEVVIVFSEPSASLLASEPVALRAKSPEPEASTAMTMMLDATTSEEVVEEMSVPENSASFGLQFRLRTEEK